MGRLKTREWKTREHQKWIFLVNKDIQSAGVESRPKKSPLLSLPLRSSNVRVNFLVSCQTLHSKSTRCAKQASIITRFSFLKPSLSILFLLLRFPLPRFPLTRFQRPFSIQFSLALPPPYSSTNFV